MTTAIEITAHETIEFTVEALTALWATPNPSETPAASPGLILERLWASAETTDDHPDETKKVKVYGPISSSPGPWLSEGIVDSLRSDQIPPKLTKAEQSRYERLRLAQEGYREYRHDNDKAPAPFLGENGTVFNLNLLKGVGSVREKRGKKAKNTEAIPVYTPVSDRELDAAYSAWAATPTPETQGAFYEALHGFVQVRFKQSKAIGPLIKADEIEDAAGDFMIEIMETLQRMAALYYLEEKTQVECGEELGITQGAISKQLTRVREYIAAKRKVSK